MGNSAAVRHLVDLLMTVVLVLCGEDDTGGHHKGDG